MVDKNYILIGASSDLSIAFQKLVNSKNLYLVSTKIDSSKNSLNVIDYIEDCKSITTFIKNVKNPIVIFFNGFLAENRPIQKPSILEIEKTVIHNYVVPTLLTNELLKNNLKVKKFVYISSFAVVKPRYKNYIYGNCKLLLEENIKSKHLKNYLFIRFGKINTKLSHGHKRTVFDLSPEKAANYLIKKINKNTGTVYPNFQTYVLAIVFKLIPINLINKLNL